MKKGLISKLYIALGFLIFCYTAFYIFEVFTLEKQTKNMIEEANAFLDEKSKASEEVIRKSYSNARKPYFSVGKIKASVFFFSPKVTITDFKLNDIPGPNSLGLRNILAKQIEVKTSIFSSAFSIKTPEPLVFEGEDNKQLASVAFSPDTEINFSFSKDKIAHFKYVSSGSKIFNWRNEIIFTHESKDSVSELVVGDVSRFKSNHVGSKGVDVKNNIIYSAESLSLDVGFSTSKEQKRTANIAINLKDFEVYKANNDGASHVPNKNNFIVSLAYTLTPNSAAQTSKKDLIAVNLDKFDFSNSLYKIAINGAAANFVDDEIPSGFLTIKIENLDNLITSIVAGFRKIAEEVKRLPEYKNDAETHKMFVEMVVQFLDGLRVPLKELATKHELSKDNLTVFEIKRDKGADISVNHLSALEAFALLQPKAQHGLAPSAMPAPQPIVPQIPQVNSNIIKP